MKTREQQLIVVTASEEPGFDVSVFPLLNDAFETARPDYLDRLYCGLTSFFRPDADGLIRVERLIERLDSLKQSIPALAHLRIGVALGPVLAEYSWLGTLKRITICGPTVAEAVACEKISGEYRKKLQDLKEGVQPNGPANGSHRIRSGTVRTSSDASAGR